MRGKFTRGNPQDFHYQVRWQSETERIRRVSSTSTDVSKTKTTKTDDPVVSNEDPLVLSLFFSFDYTLS